MAPDTASTRMFREAAESPEVVTRLLERNDEAVRELTRRLHEHPPRFIVTCARGSSDHAATYAKYVFETQLGLVTASASPSVTSVYGARQQLDGALYLAISQSGRSPDLVAHAQGARAAGALTVALVNVADSPLAAVADLVLPLHAGPETSVAATKSYIAALAAVAQLAAHWAGDEALLRAVHGLPQALRATWQGDWQPLVDDLAEARNLYVVGRGLGFGVAQEAALKLKEVCGLHAEAFSAAEVRHGPMTLVGPGFPVLFFAQRDDTLPGMLALIEEFRTRGARVRVAAPDDLLPDVLPVGASSHPACTPIAAIAGLYRAANALALRRGRNPDAPPHLAKVTETV